MAATSKLDGQAVLQACHIACEGCLKKSKL
jgi:hypothetical protein